MKMYDIILSPAIVKAIKDVEDGKGVQLLDLQWEAQSIENRDKDETCFTFYTFAKGNTITFEEPKIESEVKKESET